MKTLATLTLATAFIGFAAVPISAADAPFSAPSTQPKTIQARTLSLKSTPTPRLAAKQNLTYSERFDLEERFVDTVVYTMMDTDPDLIEFLFDINAVRVSSDGQFATVVWRYDRSISGVTLLEQQGDYIAILAEHSEALPQQNLEIIGVPAEAAAEIAIN